MATLRAPPLGTITLNNSVEYLPSPKLKREGGMGKKPKHKLACKQQAIATTLCEELQASNCIYKTRGAPARGIRPSPTIAGETAVRPALLRG